MAGTVAPRMSLAEIVANLGKRAQVESISKRLGSWETTTDNGSTHTNFNMGRDFTQEDLDFLDSLGVLNFDGGVGKLQDRLNAALVDPTFLPVNTRPQDFGKNADLNRFLADKFDFNGDFGSQYVDNFGAFTAKQGITSDQVNAAVQEFYQKNPGKEVPANWRGVMGLPTNPADDPTNTAYDPFGASGGSTSGGTSSTGGYRTIGGPSDVFYPEPMVGGPSDVFYPEPMVDGPGGAGGGIDLGQLLGSLFGGLNDAIGSFATDFNLDALKPPTVQLGASKDAADRIGAASTRIKLDPELARRWGLNNTLDSQGVGLIF